MKMNDQFVRVKPFSVAIGCNGDKGTVFMRREIIDDQRGHDRGRYVLPLEK